MATVLDSGHLEFGEVMRNQQKTEEKCPEREGPWVSHVFAYIASEALIILIVSDMITEAK